mmetsp:Transcript_22596/g.66372  ORF Transcript_22596/g.66372 Transcript_22596/m.66372 type:complete len:529 (+) Transcript_22596:104-1690(+)
MWLHPWHERRLDEVVNRSSFSCKGREMSGLSRAHSLLAHRGLISPTLRAASTVYYWRHTAAQERSRHEAVCSKASGWHLASFGSHGSFADRASWICRRARHEIGGRSRSAAPRVLDSCTTSNLTSLPRRWRVRHNVSRAVRGAGYWKWKPFYLLKRLAKLADGDVLVHLDYDLTITDDASALFCLGQNAERGVALIHFPCWTDRQWSKAELVRALNATDAMLDTAQVYGGVVVLRKTPFAVQFLREWLQVATDPDRDLSEDVPCRRHDPPGCEQRARRPPGCECAEWATPQDPAFREHRHDQSIVSLLAKRHGLKTFPMPTASHDPRSLWSWDAGYCEAAWPLETSRGGERYLPRVYSPKGKMTSPGVVLHYLQMGTLPASIHACAATGHPPTHMDYLDGRAVIARLEAAAAMLRPLRGVPSHRAAPASSRGLCRVSLVTQESQTAKCEEGVSFGCMDSIRRGPRGAHLGDVVWIFGGCRGRFRCDNSGIELRCGMPGWPSRQMYRCPCVTPTDEVPLGVPLALQRAK